MQPSSTRACRDTGGNRMSETDSVVAVLSPSASPLSTVPCCVREAVELLSFRPWICAVESGRRVIVKPIDGFLAERDQFTSNLLMQLLDSGR